MGDEVLRITVPMCPPTELRPNARTTVGARGPRNLHWQDKRKIAATFRDAAYWPAREVGLTVPLAWRDGVPVRCRITIAWGPGRRTMDGDGALSACKHAIDGTCAGLGIDDRILTFEPVIQERDPAGLGYVVLELWQEGRSDG